MKDVLKVVNQKMNEIGINYFTGRRKTKPEYPYFVGQLYHLGTDQEDGRENYELLLDGFSRADDMELIEAAEKIKGAFPPNNGYRAFIGKNLIVIRFESLIPEIPSEEDLYRNEIRLTIKKWKGVVIDE